MINHNLTRRSFLQRTSLISLLGLSSALMGQAGISFANVQTNKRLIIVLLRGGLDGLSAVPPLGDPNYKNLRQNLAIPEDIAYPLTTNFALHPAFEPIFSGIDNDEFLCIHAVASPYRQRSHFDAQNVLEIGSNKPHALKSGWLNRLAAAIDSKNGKLSLAIGSQKPLIISGDQPTGSWAPSGLPEPNDVFFRFAEKLYKNDAALSRNLKEAIAIDDKVDRLFHDKNDRQMARQARSKQGFPTLAEAAGKLLAEADGPRLATLEMGGWDTHLNQGDIGGQLSNNLGLLAQGLAILKNEMHNVWSNTAIVALTEFGRTARPNGSQGTDHGMGGVALLFGGAVNGKKRVLTQWPGLKPELLFENRDLAPTLDIRSVMKGLIHDLYGVPDMVLDHDIYPNSDHIDRLRGLVHLA